MIIDIHAHTFPDRIAPVAIDKLKKAGGIHPFSDGTVGGLADSMRRAGIDYSVILPVATNPLKVRSMNDLSMQMQGEEGLVYFGCIHPDAPDACGELERIARGGLAGIKIHPVYQGVDIDDVRFLRILEKAGELDLIVLMHAGDDIGFPGVVRCSPEMTARAVLQAGPVKLICAHMGGWNNWERVADCLAHTSVMLDTAYCLGDITPLEPSASPGARGHMLDAERFCRLVDAFGAERILFGTDTPWSDQTEYLAQIRALPLGEEDMHSILGGNAARLLGL